MTQGGHGRYEDIAKTYTEGDTSMRPVAGIFALFAKNLVTRLAGTKDKGSRSIDRTCFFPSELV
jgi:hypothetical protein